MKAWNWLIFLAALAAAASLVVELAYELPEEQKTLIELLDIGILGIFAIDLLNEHRRFRGSEVTFAREHWLDILAILPIFRIVRIAKLARLEELAKLERITEIRKGAEAEAVISKSIHAKRLKKKRKD